MLPKYKKEHECDVGDDLTTPIPKNLFIKPNGSNVFKSKIEENHAYEQFFWTSNMVDNLKKSLDMVYVSETCGLMTPSLIHSMEEDDRHETLLDIDKRFNYLPKFTFYDVTNPHTLDEKFKLLVIDPPFFIIPIEKIANAVDVLTNKCYETKILIAFLKRAEQRLRKAFINYKLYPTTFKLEYASIKENKWKNFCLYSNIDLPKIRRIIDC